MTSTFKLDLSTLPDPETIFVPDTVTLIGILDERFGAGSWDIELDEVENGLFHVILLSEMEVGTFTFWTERRASR